MKRFLAVAIFACALHGSAYSADTPFINDLLDSVREAAQGWGTRIMPATWVLFWSLCLINIVWNVGSRYMMNEVATDRLFMEFGRLTIIVGFFAFVLKNINDIAHSIIESMIQLGTSATGGKAEYRVMEIFAYGLQICEAAINKLPKFSFLNKAGILIGAIFDEDGIMGQLGKYYDSFISIFIVVLVLIIVCVIYSYIIMQLISGYVLCFGGAFFLGFSSFEQTRPIAINYLKSILIVGVNLFAILFFADMFTDLVGPGLERMASHENDISVQQILATVALGMITCFLVVRIPMVIGSIVMGAGVAAQMGAEFSAFRLMWQGVRLAAKATPKTAAAAEAIEKGRKAMDKVKDKGDGNKLEQGSAKDAKNKNAGGGVGKAVKAALKGKGK